MKKTNKKCVFSTENVFSRGYNFFRLPITLNKFEARTEWSYQWGASVFCCTCPEELFPVLKEFVRVIGSQQLVSLDFSKNTLLGLRPEKKQAIPLKRFRLLTDQLLSKLLTQLKDFVRHPTNAFTDCRFFFLLRLLLS